MTRVGERIITGSSDGFLEVAIVHYDDGALAAQLQGHLLQVTSASREDALSGGHGSREGYLFDTLVVN